jgi:hypothetical protein
LPTLVPDADKRATIMQRVNTIVNAGEATQAERDRITRLSQMLVASIGKPEPAKTTAIVAAE